MSKYEIPYLTACIQAFGRCFSMTRQATFRYLHEYTYKMDDAALQSDLSVK